MSRQEFKVGDRVKHKVHGHLGVGIIFEAGRYDSWGIRFSDYHYVNTEGRHTYLSGELIKVSEPEFKIGDEVIGYGIESGKEYCGKILDLNYQWGWGNDCTEQSVKIALGNVGPIVIKLDTMRHVKENKESNIPKPEIKNNYIKDKLENGEKVARGEWCSEWLPDSTYNVPPSVLSLKDRITKYKNDRYVYNKEPLPSRSCPICGLCGCMHSRKS